VPDIVAVNAAGNTATLDLSPPIPAEQWTCFTHVASGTSTCLGFLPADADGGGRSLETDITRVIDCVNGGESCDLWECDMDRSGRCAPPDILRIIDLLGGAEQYTAWLEAVLPPCPSAP
jgi:hypothetical protein